MLLAANVGNTNVVVGTFEQERLLSSERIPLPKVEREMLGTSGAMADFCRGVSEIAAAGVNPPIQERFSRWAAESLGVPASWARRDFGVPLRNRCQPPESVGTDRLLNAYAAHCLFPGEDAIVVDFGTAMSFSVVSARGEFPGGVIAPGLRMCTRALHEQTASLPEVEPEGADAATGASTEAAINAALTWGLPGMLDRILEQLIGERGGPVNVLGTGGDLVWFQPLSTHGIQPFPDLTLQGLAFAYSHHKSAQSVG